MNQFSGLFLWKIYDCLLGWARKIQSLFVGAMAVKLVGAVLALLVVFCAGSPCTSSHRYASSSPSGHFGCDGYDGRLTISWLIQPTDAAQRILLEFDSFNTEANYDFMKIYDGKPP